MNENYNTIIILAGDFVKFGFTMASTTTILAWGYLSYKDAYEEVSKYNMFSCSYIILYYL